MKTYFDESYGDDDHGDKWITLAGIAATDAVWADFDGKWKKMLASRYPVAPYIHMIELMGHDDPFELAVGWDFSKKEKLVDDAIVLLSQMDKAGILMARCSINESARVRLSAERLKVPTDPAFECAKRCVDLTVGTYTLNTVGGPTEPLYVFYDRGEKFLGYLKNNWLSRRSAPGKRKKPHNPWDRFADIQDLDMANHGPLQLADMIAWSHSRSLRDVERPFSNLKVWLQRVCPSVNVEITEETMRRQALALAASLG